MKEMCWLPCNENKLKIVLHLREYPDRPWKMYTDSPHFVPDYKVPGGSEGWATFQKLRKIGWTIISSDRAKVSNLLTLTNKPKK
jgi:hypothetical protein